MSDDIKTRDMWSDRQRALMRQTIEKLRAETASQFYDKTDRDEYVLSCLDLTADDLSEIYAGHETEMPGRLGLAGDVAPAAPTYRELEPFIGCRMSCSKERRPSGQESVVVRAFAYGGQILFTEADVPALKSYDTTEIAAVRVVYLTGTGTEGREDIALWSYHDDKILFQIDADDNRKDVTP